MEKYSEELDCIYIKGAREHNLKNIEIEIPKKKLIVFTGVSGSGKSSLAIDTIFAEGQRRYIESLSSYARQFLGQMEKPKYDTIRGLAPSISIEQKAASNNPRSTVGTITEIYDYLRVLYARTGVQHCKQCGKRVGRGDPTQIIEQICSFPEGTKFFVLVPVVENRKGEHREELLNLKKDGYARVRIDGIIRELSDIQSLDKNKKHNVEIVLDRLVASKSKDFKKRLSDTIEIALRVGGGYLIIHILDREDIKMSIKRACCDTSYPQLEPVHFSFNAPQGMCMECNGLGVQLTIDIKKVIPNEKLSIREGAIMPWRGYFQGKEIRDDSWGLSQFKALEKQWGIDFDCPWNKLPQQQKKWLLYGRKNDELNIKWHRIKGSGSLATKWEGLIPTLMRRYRQTQSEYMKQWYGKFMSTLPCKACEGKRLKSEILHVYINQKSIADLTQMTIGEAKEFLANLKLNETEKIIAGELLKEINSRLDFLINVGLEYLSLNRKGPSLSGGEAQRIRLASQIGSELSGVLYILDEPSIGLHQRDNIKLIETFRKLRNLGNTLIVIEHDKETMEAADWIVDFGPGAGLLGGQVIYSGVPEQIKSHMNSLTGAYLSGREIIEVPQVRRSPDARWIEILGAKENNLQNVHVKIPVGLFTCITGVSGAGKSTLIKQILFPALCKKLHSADVYVGKHEKLIGLEHIDKVIDIDQKPIGKTPRSNPATYTKVFDYIRELFAQLPESKIRGYSGGRFSFNVKGGRCESCQGDGLIRVEMHFLADVYIPCEKCLGRRFNEATLGVKFKGHSIADILELSVIEAKELFKNQKKIFRVLQTLDEVGLSYIKLGQSATTLSGGEAQRIKLARELAKNETGRTLYILDEPTTGLHFDDIKKLLKVLQRLVDGGNTVIVIEHNLDVIKCADWLIDLGPEGGKNGGKIIGVGSPETLAKNLQSVTGRYL